MSAPGYCVFVALGEIEAASLTEALSSLLGGGHDTRIWFRGQGCHRRALVPSLYRRMSGSTVEQILEMERRLIVRFRQRSLPWWPEGYPQTDWEQLFAMQHHGVPTRLLDWTENALSGIYFASDHDRARCECGQNDCWPTLWVLNPARFNQLNKRLAGMPVGILTPTPQDGGPTDFWRPGVSEALFAPSPIAIYGTHNSVRIAAQQGTFTIAGKDLLPLEQSEAVDDATPVLVKYTIKTDHQALRAELRRLGVARSSVYPELPSLAVDITDEEGL